MNCYEVGDSDTLATPGCRARLMSLKFAVLFWSCRLDRLCLAMEAGYDAR